MAAARYHEGQFPPVELEWERLIPLLGPASAALARYDGVLGAIPNAQVLLSPLTTQEAVLSSRIEGTQATMGEVLEYEAGAGADQRLEPRKVGDIQEVMNYRRALAQAAQSLGELPLSGRLIREAHVLLMEGVRGEGKRPGAYRPVQNWIGPKGCTQDEARYVPIPPQHLPDGISRWEKYLNSRQPDALVQLAVVHVEFEALHPFIDGNGRLGRMLVPLFLYERQLLATPTFYISGYLEARREAYYERLLAVSRDGDWTGWCEFFLHAMIAQAESNTRKVRDILELYETRKNWVVEQTHSQYAIRALDYVFNRPMFRTTDFVAQAGMPEASAKRILPILRDEGLLRVFKEGAGRRPAILVFPELFNIAEGREVF